MNANHDLPPAACKSETPTAGIATSRRVLDPVSRASEVLFGLIMVLTFTLSLGAAESGRDDVRACSSGRWDAILPGPSSMP
jgi:hypothetical protein